MVVKGAMRVRDERGIWLMTLPVWMLWVLVVGIWGEVEVLSDDETGVGFLAWWMLCMLSFAMFSVIADFFGV